MKSIGLIISLFFIISSCNKTTNPSSITSINELGEVDFSTGDNILIDVRTPEEYAEGHLANAINLNVVDADFDEKINRLDRTKTYYVYCKSGFRSTKATTKMKEEGFKKIINLQDGYVAYKGELVK